MHNEVVFALRFHEELKMYFPEAIICSVNDGLPYKFRAKAIREYLDSYSVANQSDDILKLVQECDAFEEDNFLPSFLPKRKKKLSDIDVKSVNYKQLISYLDKKLNAFFVKLKQSECFLISQFQRNENLSEYHCRISSDVLHVQLILSKNPDGLQYEQKVYIRDKSEFTLKDSSVIIPSRRLPYVLIDSTFFTIDGVDAAKLIPFQTKNAINIPSKLVKDYLEKFVLPILENVELKTEGLPYEIDDEITEVSIDLTQDFISSNYILSPRFYYKYHEFIYAQPRQERSKIIFDKAGNPSILHTIRNKGKEDSIINDMLDEQVYINASKRIQLNENLQLSEWSIIKWVQQSQKRLQDKVKFNNLGVQDKLVNLDTFSISLSSSPKIDWFELHAVIQVGEFQISFVELLDHIDAKNPLYNLPNGEVFIIPDSWMTKYSSIAKLRKKDGKGVKLAKSQFTVIDELDMEGSQKMLKTFERKEIDYTTENLKATLRPYQKDGVDWLLSVYDENIGLLLADDMGLGKTLQTIAVLDYAKDNKTIDSSLQAPTGQLTLFQAERIEEIRPLNALIVVPASLIFNWKAELKQFAPHLNVKEYIGSKRQNVLLDQFDVIITSYGTIRNDIERFKKVHWEYIVLDESQMIKNVHSQIFKKIVTLPSQNRISLSGTPIENNLSNLWTQMHFLNPDLLGDYAFFKEHFQNPIEKQADESAIDELNKLISEFIKRRTKQEVLKDLPELHTSVKYVGMTSDQHLIYDQEKNAIRNQLFQLDPSSRGYATHVFQALSNLRQIANHPKMKNEDYDGESAKFKVVKEHIETLVKSGKKMLLFSSFTKHLKLFRDYLEYAEINYRYMDGSVSSERRQQMVDEFQQDESISVFLISIKTGGTGLNLTAADYVLILDPWWNPFLEHQATARAHRIGRQNAVTMIRFITKDTIEEKIHKLQKKKESLAEAFIKSGNEVNMSVEDMRFLLD